MLNRYASTFAMSSRADSVCANPFCAEMNNTLILDNAIALSIFICLIMIALLLALLLAQANDRNPLNWFHEALKLV